MSDSVTRRLFGKWLGVGLIASVVVIAGQTALGAELKLKKPEICKRELERLLKSELDEFYNAIEASRGITIPDDERDLAKGRIVKQSTAVLAETFILTD